MYVSAPTYLEALFLLLGDNSDRSRALVREFLEVTDKQNSGKEMITTDDDLITFYRGLIKSVLVEKIDQENETAAKMLLLRIRSNDAIKSYPAIKDLLTDVLTAKDPITADQIDRYLKRLRNVLLGAKMDVSSRKIFAKSRALFDIEDVDEQENSLLDLKMLFDQSLKTIDQQQSASDVRQTESYVSLSDAASVERSLTKYMERSVTGVLKSGLQGLNKALGDRGGIGLGETAVFLARSHNYKSGILVSWMRWICAYNKFLVEPGKRAMMYFVSIENEVHQNLMALFKAIYYLVESDPADVKTLSPEFIKQWLINYFAQFDIDLYIDRFTPHEFSFQKFINRYNNFVEMGFQIIAFDLDYMSEVRGIDPGDTFSAQGQIQLIKENYSKFGNHAKQCGYALITAHQLTKRADEIAAQHKYAVKKFNPSMIADSSDVFRAVDIVVWLNLEVNIDGVKFLMGWCTKNRGNEDTPERDKFFAYAFTPRGIPDDINGLSQSVEDVDAYNSGSTVVTSEFAEVGMF